jgi:hypothetical protein
VICVWCLNGLRGISTLFARLLCRILCRAVLSGYRCSGCPVEMGLDDLQVIPVFKHVLYEVDNTPMWPFRKHSGKYEPACLKLIPKDPIELTKEEQDEVQKGFDRVHQSAGPGQRLAVKKEHVQSFQYSIAAMALHWRAEELALQLRIGLVRPTADRERIIEEMLSAASKACAFFPVPIYLYHLGCAMELAGKVDDACETFRMFLHWQREFKPDEIHGFGVSDDGIPEAIAYADKMVSA